MHGIDYCEKLFVSSNFAMHEARRLISFQSMAYKTFVLIGFILSFTNGFTYIGTEDSLRENIRDLGEGKLKISDENLPPYEGELDDITPNNNTEYDFVIIGAGSAGATIASRLSEVRNITVLLIEAGSKEYPLMDIPLIVPYLQLNDQINWKYRTERSDKFCKGMLNFQCNWPRGKVMGGSSVLNFMVASRGNKENYDEWASISGDDSWSYKNMLHYLKKLEDFHVKEVKFDSEIHNKGGPVRITSTSFHTPLGQAFVEAGKEQGYSTVDYNGKNEIGYSYFQYTISHGERWSTNRAYLYPAKNRTNLFLTRDSFVNKILIDEQSKTAVGVNFSKNGKEYVVRAKKEIILSAGAINSPQILMLSGIGPEKHLQKLNIKVIKIAAVGENLIDHVGYGGLVFKTNISVSAIESNILDPQNPAINDYITSRNGTLAAGPGFEAVAFLNIDQPCTTHVNPNIEFAFGVNPGMKGPLTATIAGITEHYQSQILLNQTDHAVWTTWPLLTQPKSRGKLLLRSTNPRDHPKIYPNYFDNPDDVRLLIKSIREVIKLSKTKAFQKYDSQLYDMPICNDREYDSDEYWECIIKTFTLTIYHPSSTCKMGQENDNTAVVNSRLNVIGVNNLRVADASIMPNIISGHPNIPIIAIAEKLSDMVKEDWGFRSHEHACHNKN